MSTGIGQCMKCGEIYDDDIGCCCEATTEHWFKLMHKNVNLKADLDRHRRAIEHARRHLSWLSNHSVKFKGTDAWTSANTTLKEIDAILAEGK